MVATVKSDCFTIGDWTPADSVPVQLILKAAQAAHQKRYPDEAWFTWKFTANPFGAPIVKVATSPDGLVAGMVAFSIAEISVGKDIIPAAYSIETFVTPEFQGMGLFGALIDAAQDSARSRRLQLLYNFPNGNSRPGFLKKSWSDVGGVDSWLLPVRPAGLVGALLRGKGHIGSFVADRLKESTPNANFSIPEREYFPLHGSASDLATHRRIPEFLAWRYNVCPLFRYLTMVTEEGWAIVRPGHRQGLREVQLLDIFSFKAGLSSFALRKVISGIICEIKNTFECDFISFYCSESSRLSTILASLLFLKVPNRINFFNQPLVRGRSHPAHWLLTGTDFHTF